MFIGAIRQTLPPGLLDLARPINCVAFMRDAQRIYGLIQQQLGSAMPVSPIGTTRPPSPAEQATFTAIQTFRREVTDYLQLTEEALAEIVPSVMGRLPGSLPTNIRTQP